MFEQIFKTFWKAIFLTSILVVAFSVSFFMLLYVPEPAFSVSYIKKLVYFFIYTKIRSFVLIIIFVIIEIIILPNVENLRLMEMLKTRYSTIAGNCHIGSLKA